MMVSKWRFSWWHGCHGEGGDVREGGRSKMSK